MSLVKVDLDTPRVKLKLAQFWRRLEVFEHITDYVCDWVETETSRNGGVHVWVKFVYPLCDLEVLAVQALLGSDYIREMHNFKRIRAGQVNWNILFEGKGDKTRVGRHNLK